jgi:5-formyltetrahydrofolate cyclo-ligase
MGCLFKYRMSSTNPLKGQLRQFYKQQRLALGAELRHHLSRQICQNLRSSAIFAHSDRIFAYFAIQGEPDLTTLWQAFPHKVWVFPRCQGQELVWHPLTIDRLAQDTYQGKYGLPMPRPQLPQVPLAEADLVLVPALALDKMGFRLGYGGGFYDRCLAKHPVPTIGITYSQFVVDRLPRDGWDIPLGGICTDRGLDSFCPLP